LKRSITAALNLTISGWSTRQAACANSTWPGPGELWARVVQRLLALNAAIWFNWQISAPVKRSLVAYDQ
jgi:hypothetical protein